MLQKDVKQVIISLISELDFYFEENEFIRRSNSLTYIRKLDGVTQKVEIVFFSNPSYHPGALAHIYPHMQIYIPSVNATTKEYASHLIPSKWLDQFTIRQPIQIYSNLGDFWLVDVNEYESLKDQLLDFFEKNAISLFNDLMSDKDYLLLYENKDKRIMWGEINFVSEPIQNFAFASAEKTMGSPGYDIDIEADDIDVTDTVTVIWKIK